MRDHEAVDLLVDIIRSIWQDYLTLVDDCLQYFANKNEGSKGNWIGWLVGNFVDVRLENCRRDEAKKEHRPNDIVKRRKLACHLFFQDEKSFSHMSVE